MGRITVEDWIHQGDVFKALEKVCKQKCPYYMEGRPEVCKYCLLGDAFEAVDEVPIHEPIDPDDYY